MPTRDERWARDLSNQMTRPPDYVARKNGRAFLDGTAPIEVATSRGPAPFVLFGVGCVLFAVFVVLVRRGGDISFLVFMVTLLGGMFGVLVGGIMSVSSLMSPLVASTATHIVEGSIDRIRFLRQAGVFQVRVRYLPPDVDGDGGDGQLRTVKFMLPVKTVQQKAIDPGTTMAVIYSARHDDGEAL